MSTSKSTILLTGGTGKIAARIAPLLSANGNTILIASRSGTTPSLPKAQAIKFDWLDPSTHSSIFTTHLPSPITSIFLVAPPITDPFPLMKSFIDLAITHSVRRFVLLSASLLDAGDGPMMARVAKYLEDLAEEKKGIEYAVLRPTWFMEDFSEMQHAITIRDEDIIVTATGDGKVPFVSASDIADVAFHALTDEVSFNSDLLILGPELWSYDEVATLISHKLNRKITHVNVSEAELARIMSTFMSEDYAKLLAKLDTAIKEGEEARLNGVVERVTGKKARDLRNFVDFCVAKDVWGKV